MKINVNMITTTFDLPGYRIVQSCGIIRGISVRSAGAVGGFVAGLQSLWAQKNKTFTAMCEKTRSEAFDLLIEHAQELGANAIIGVRFDANEVNTVTTEILAYGTAVIVEKI
ncbi:MAG TPA: heavy metal-binding domain-containing protein [Candidatus Babeliales bacterium]|nr:heavy metal-binding domain-containing protein [Candidatus Babeliales bacterium]